MAQTEGQRRLLAIVREKGRGAQADIARRIGRSEPSVSAMLRGRSRPDGDARIAIHRELGIPPETWSQKPKRNGNRNGKAA